MQSTQGVREAEGSRDRETQRERQRQGVPEAGRGGGEGWVLGGGGVRGLLWLLWFLGPRARWCLPPRSLRPFPWHGVTQALGKGVASF